MKKAIWAAVLAAIVSIFAISCSKTSMNSSKLIGTWKLVSVTVAKGSASETQTVTGGYTIQFVKGGSIFVSETTGSRTYSYSGTWNVIDDDLYTVFDDEVTTLHIDEINGKSLTLTHNETSNGTVYSVTESFAKI